MSMSLHVSRTVSTCFYQLRRLKSVRRSLPIQAAKTIINSFIISRVDYCNGILFGVTKKQTLRVQSILNASARVLYGGSMRDHITPLIRDRLHWLRYGQRTTYKLCLMAYKSLHGCAPPYIVDLVVPVSINQYARRLRSSDTLCIQQRKSRLQFGERCFSVSASRVWNTLPVHVRLSPSLNIFR